MACKECPPEGAPGWIVTYGDLMTLLLCFFVLLFSFSSLDKKRYETLRESMTGAFGVMSGSSTSMGSGISRKSFKVTDKNFDRAVSEFLVEVKDVIPPKERLNLKFKALLEASDALKMISKVKEEIIEIVQEKEEPRSINVDSISKPSVKQQVDAKDETPRNQSEDEVFMGASPQRKLEKEVAKDPLEQAKAKGENFDNQRADNTKQDVADGREQILLDNSGRQRSKDKKSGTNHPLEDLRDKELRRSENKDYDFKRPIDTLETLKEYKALAGLVQLAPYDASHVVFQIDSELIFKDNSEELKELAKEKVFMLFSKIYKSEEFATFQIEAHTDLAFKPSEKYPTSWHLAAARAESVLNFLLSESPTFKRERFSLVSFGAWQPKFRYKIQQTKLPYNNRLEVRVFREP